MASKTEKLAKATLLLMFTVALSRVLGYGREWAINTLFGQSYATDVYRAAFSVPDLIYLLMAGGALSAAFIPVFSSYLDGHEEERGWRTASIVLNYVILFSLILIAVAYWQAPAIINQLVPGLPGDYLSIGAHLTRIMFIQTLFMALNGFSMGILHSYNRFTGPALGALVYNVVIILVGLAFYKSLGVAAFSYGVVLGAVVNFLVQLPFLRRVGIRYHFCFDWRDEGFQKIMLLMLPVMVGLGVGQVNLLVTQHLASLLGPGIVSALDLGQKIMQLPLGILSGSVGVTIFPILAVLSARGEREEFKRALSLGLRLLFLVSIPATFGIIALKEPLVSLFFEQGQFTREMTGITSQALFFYCLSLFAYTALQVVNRAFFSLQDTKTPVLAAVAAVAANILLSLTLSPSMGYQGLALAYSLAGFANLFLLLGTLRRRLGQMGGSLIMKSLLLSTLASLLMYLLVRVFVNYTGVWQAAASKSELLLAVGGGTLLGLIVYCLLLLPFKLEESQLVLTMVKKKLHLAA